MSYIDSSPMFRDLEMKLLYRELVSELSVHYRDSFMSVNVYYRLYDKPSTMKKLISKLVKKPLEINKDRYIIEVNVDKDKYVADVLTIDKLENFIPRVISVKDYEIKITEI